MYVALYLWILHVYTCMVYISRRGPSVAPRKCVHPRNTISVVLTKFVITDSVSVGSVHIDVPFPLARPSLTFYIRYPWSTATEYSTESVVRGGPAGLTSRIPFSWTTQHCRDSPDCVTLFKCSISKIS